MRIVRTKIQVMPPWERVLRALVFGTPIFLAGCASLDGYPRRLEYADQFIDDVGALASPAAIIQYNSENDPTRQTLLRNNIITARIYAIDANFHKFVQELTGQQNAASVATDWAAIGMATGGFSPRRRSQKPYSRD
jgi:hypothetical protein